MQVRLLKSGDDALHIEAVRLLNDEAEMSEERSAELLREPTYFFLVALSDLGEIMGRVYGNVIHRFGQTDLLLYEVDVVEAHHRKGVGRAMLEFLKGYCAEKGYREMWVLTEGDNQAARGLYASAGGVEVDYPTVMYDFYI